MNNILSSIPIFLLLTLLLAFYLLVFGALFPSRVDKASEHLRGSLWRAFWIGLVNFLFFGAIVLLLFALSEGVRKSFLGVLLLLPAATITIAIFAFLSLGLASISAILGERLFPEAAAWKRSFFATLLLGVGCTVPLLGWFLLFPFAALTGFGAVLLTYYQRNK
jgi:hypothetical protein